MGGNDTERRPQRICRDVTQLRKRGEQSVHRTYTELTRAGLGDARVCLGMWARRPVSRVLCRPGPRARTRRPFLWTASRDAVLATNPDRSDRRRSCPPLLTREGARPLFGLAPGGACHAVPLAGPPVRSYRTLSPLPSDEGGLLSVALSLGSLPVGVTHRLVVVEPGLSSTGEKPAATARPSGPGAVWRSAARRSTAVNLGRSHALRPT